MKIILRISTCLCFAFLLTACCFKKDITEYNLKPGDTDILPYKEGQQLIFRHSGGSNITFFVRERYKDVYEERANSEEPFDCPSYYYYESEKTTIVAANPHIEISFEIFGNKGEEPAAFRIDGLSNIFKFQQPPGNCTPTKEYDCLDSVKLLNRTFYNVIQITPDSSDIITNYLRAKSILYNRQEGLLQIKMNNNESYTLTK